LRDQRLLHGCHYLRTRRRLGQRCGLGAGGSGDLFQILGQRWHQRYEGVKEQSETKVGVVEYDFLGVGLVPFLEQCYGNIGDHVWLDDLELPLDLVVLIMEVVEQHPHIEEVLLGDGHGVGLLII
jgi:hypothetical protein